MNKIESEEIVFTPAISQAPPKPYGAIPWSSRINHNTTMFHQEIVDAAGRVMLEFFGGHLGESDTHVELAIRAVNSHAALVEALEMVRDQLQVFGARFPNNAQEILRPVLAALALAKGGTPGDHSNKSAYQQMWEARNSHLPNDMKTFGGGK